MVQDENTTQTREWIPVKEVARRLGLSSAGARYLIRVKGIETRKDPYDPRFTLVDFTTLAELRRTSIARKLEG